MKKTIAVILCMLTILSLCSCGITQKAGDASLGASQAETRATRIKSLSSKLDQYEATLEGIKYGRKVKKALKKAQELENTAISNQNDSNKNIFWWDWNGDKACDEFEKAINNLQNAMNNDTAVRKEVARQNSVSADDETAGIFGGASAKYLRLFLIFAAVLIAIIIALAVLRGAGKKPVKETKPKPKDDSDEVKLTEAERQLEEDNGQDVKKAEEAKKIALRDTSNERFERECKELGHNPVEVLEYFGSDVKLAHTYISMEVNMRKQGIEKTYKQLYEESEA